MSACCGLDCGTSENRQPVPSWAPSGKATAAKPAAANHSRHHRNRPCLTMICVFHYELDGSKEPTPSRHRWGSLISSWGNISATMLPETITRGRSTAADLRERAGADTLDTVRPRRQPSAKQPGHTPGAAGSPPSPNRGYPPPLTAT